MTVVVAQVIGHAATAPHGQGRSCVITRRATFSSSHLYCLPELSSAENQLRFGACSQAPGHGHNYELIVSMEGGLDANGMVLNLSDVKHAIRSQVTEQKYQCFCLPDTSANQTPLQASSEQCCYRAAQRAAEEISSTSGL